MGINSNNWYDEMEESEKNSQESKETLEQKGSSLSISSEGDIVMTVTGEDGKQKAMPLREFLNLTPEELRDEFFLIQTGFILVGEKIVLNNKSWYPEWFERFTKEYRDLFISGRRRDFHFSLKERLKPYSSNPKCLESDRGYAMSCLVFARLDIPKIIGMLREDLQRRIERESLLRGMTREGIMLSIMAARIYRSIWIKDCEKDIQTYKDKDLFGEISEEVSRTKKLGDFELLDIFLRKLYSVHFGKLDIHSIKKLREEFEEFRRRASDMLKIFGKLSSLSLRARLMQTQGEVVGDVFSILDKGNIIEDVLSTLDRGKRK